MGLASAAGLWPAAALACHRVPKSEGGCMRSGSAAAAGGAPAAGAAPTSLPLPANDNTPPAWTGTLEAADIGADPYRFFSVANTRWAIVHHFTANNNSRPRTTIGTAPDGRLAVQMNIPQGINYNNNFSNAPFGSRGVDAARVSVDVFLPPGFDWGTSNGKLAFGLWGGDGRVSGGVPPGQQKGFSVRNVRGSNAAGWGIKLYSYHLNRNSGNFGQVSPARSVPIPKGRWVNMQLEVRLNRPGAANGSSRLLMDGGTVAEMSGQVFRHDNASGIRGLFWNDMWGGTEELPANWSPRSQTMWYADYRLYAL